MTQLSDVDHESIRERLDRGLNEILDSFAKDDLSSVTIEAVAQAAKVSRATAYRHLGSREELLRRAAIGLVEGHIHRCQEALSRTTTVAQRVEEYFVYNVRESARDRRIQVLRDAPRTAGIATAINEMISTVLGPALQSGQLDGQVRDDVPVEELIAWIIDQTEALGRHHVNTEDQVRTWVRRFVLPVLDPPGNADGRLRSQVRSLLDDVQVRLQEANVSIAAGRYTFRA